VVGEQGGTWWNMKKIHLKEVKESTSLQDEWQASGSCCHKSLGKDHVSGCKKFSNKFVVCKQL